MRILIGPKGGWESPALMYLCSTVDYLTGTRCTHTRTLLSEHTADRECPACGVARDYRVLLIEILENRNYRYSVGLANTPTASQSKGRDGLENILD